MAGATAGRRYVARGELLPANGAADFVKLTAGPAADAAAGSHFRKIVEKPMPFKPNYNQKRAERSRLKQAKAEIKLREQEETRTRRKLEQEREATPTVSPDAEPSS